MTEPVVIASPEQRRRARTLAVLCVAVTSLGLAVRSRSTEAALAPCVAPALQGDLLVCDGKGALPGARAWLAGGQLDANSATERELQAIPGIGPSLAHAIVETRTERGGFVAFADLDLVPGIGPKTLAKLARYLRVAQPP